MMDESSINQHIKIMHNAQIQLDPEVEAELKVIDKLSEVWNAFITLPIEHADDTQEFRSGIHQLQEKILARYMRRIVNENSFEKHKQTILSVIKSIKNEPVVQSENCEQLDRLAIDNLSNNRIVEVSEWEYSSVYGCKVRTIKVVDNT